MIHASEVLYVNFVKRIYPTELTLNKTYNYSQLMSIFVFRHIPLSKWIQHMINTKEIFVLQNLHTKLLMHVSLKYIYLQFLLHKLIGGGSHSRDHMVVGFTKKSTRSRSVRVGWQYVTHCNIQPF
jgi:hypothetical protein